MSVEQAGVVREGEPPGEPFATKGPASRSGRRGVALILVLGFTALLLIMAFAFSVRMQGEYRTSRLSHANTRAETVMIQGLHLAALEAAHYIDSRSPQSYWFYPRRERINGSEILTGNSSGSPIPNFLASPVDQYIPSAIYDYAIANDNTSRWGIIPGRYGNMVRDWFRTCGEDFRAVAYDYEPSGVAYYLMNCSGYLDVHAPYGASGTRGCGTNASQIQLDGVIGNPSSLASGRSQHGRIESMAELYAYQNAFGLTSSGDMGAFFTYSRCPRGSYWDTNSFSMTASFVLTNIVTRVGTAAEAAMRTDILNAFERSGFDQPVAFGGRTYQPTTIRGWLYTNLIDYADTDFTPSSLLQPSQEPVANINEMAIASDFRCTLTRDNPPEYTYRLDLSVTFEVWNAYLTPASTRQYRLLIPPQSLRVTEVSGPGFATRGNNQPVNASATLGARTFAKLSPNVSIQAPPVTSSTFNNKVVYLVQFPKLELRSANEIVDQVETGSFGFTFTNTLPRAPAFLNDVVSSADSNHSVEAVDPRFNWTVSNSAFWVVGSANTLGTTNAPTLAYIRANANATDYEPSDDLDKATCMYCANKEAFDTVGELGYLCYAPWRTVRLVKGSGANRPVHTVVDTFSLFPTNAVTRGLVNPNTAHRKPLQAVFNKMPLDMYPSDTGARDLTANDAGSLADSMILATYGVSSANARYSTNGLIAGLLNISQFGGLTNFFPCSSVLSNIANDAQTGVRGVRCEIERESLVRNCAGLFNTRNTGFTVILASSDEIFGGGDHDFPIRNSSRMGAEHKAVATVWRDPWTREQFVRFFRYLPNDGALENY